MESKPVQRNDIEIKLTPYTHTYRAIQLYQYTSHGTASYAQRAAFLVVLDRIGHDRTRVIIANGNP